MLKVTFKKDHVSGIKKGYVRHLADDHAKRLEKEGYVEIHPADGSDTPPPVTNPLNVDQSKSIEFTVTKKSLKDNPTWNDLGIKEKDRILVLKEEETK